MPNPTVTVEIAFATDPLTLVPTYTDVSAFARLVRIRRGRSGDLQRFEAGTATVVLDNRDRRFEPFFTGSPHSPNIRPRKVIRIRAASGLTVNLFRGFIESWTPSYPTTGDAVCTVEAVEGSALLGELTLEVPYVRQVLLSKPLMYYRLNERIADMPEALTTGGGGTTAVCPDSSGHGHDATYSGASFTFEVIDPITDEINGAVTLTGAGRIIMPTGKVLVEPFGVEFWIKKPAPPANAQSLVTQRDPGNTNRTFVISLLASGDIQFEAAAATSIATAAVGVADNAWHHVLCTYDTDRRARLYIDSVLRATGGIGAGMAPSDGDFIMVSEFFGSATAFAGSLDEIALYDSIPATLVAGGTAQNHGHANAGLNDSTDTRITRVLDYVKWPTASSDWVSVDAGLSTMTSAGDWGDHRSALEAIRQAGDTEDGPVFIDRQGAVRFINRRAPFDGSSASSVVQATYGDLAGEVAYTEIEFLSDSVDIANRITLTVRHASPAIASDAASITKYGERAFGLNTMDSSQRLADDHAQWLLAHLKDPSKLRAQRLAFVVTDTDFAAKANREIWDRVAIRWSPPGGGARISYDVLVTGVAWDITPEVWRVAYEVSPTPVAQQYWVLGVVGSSELGTTTRLAF